MRPKPLMPTRTVTALAPREDEYWFRLKPYRVRRRTRPSYGLLTSRPNVPFTSRRACGLGRPICGPDSGHSGPQAPQGRPRRPAGGRSVLARTGARTRLGRRRGFGRGRRGRLVVVGLVGVGELLGRDLRALPQRAEELAGTHGRLLHLRGG